MEIGVKDAAKLLKVSEKTIYRWITDQKIPFSVVGSQYRFSRSELIGWVHARTRKVLENVDRQTSRPQPAGLRQAVEAGGIAYRVEGSDVPSVMRNALQVAHLPAQADRELLLKLLLEREQLCSSGMGYGVALPHPRQPVLTELPFPLIALNFPEQPIDFDAVDGRPIHAFFMIFSPTVELHLKFLGRLCYVLQQDHFRTLLRRQASRQTLLRALDDVDRKRGLAG